MTESPDPGRYGDLEDRDLFAGDAWVLPFARRRSEAPVAWQPLPGGGYWAVARHADVKQVLGDSATFKAGYGTGLRSPWDAQFDPAAPDAGMPAYRAMNATDPPQHAERRGLLGDAFAPAVVTGRAQGLRELAKTLVGGLAAAGGGDLVASVACPLAIAALGDTLGLPVGRREAIAAAVRASTYAQDPATQAGRRPSIAWREAEAALGVAIQAAFEDPASSGLAADIARCPHGMAARDAQYLLRLLVLAGQETTVAGIATALHRVLKTPGALDALRANPALVSQATEEALRWLSPIVAFGRLAARDVVLAGVPIRAGQRVACYFPSANRDEAVFADADSFRLDRRPNPHLAFGFGDHGCPGAGLARQQIRLALEALAAAPGDWEAGDWTWWRGTTKRGPSAAWVRVTGV